MFSGNRSQLITSAAMKVLKHQSSDLCSGLRAESTEEIIDSFDSWAVYVCSAPRQETRMTSGRRSRMDESDGSTADDLWEQCKEFDKTHQLYICPTSFFFLSLSLFSQSVSSGTESDPQCQVGGRSDGQDLSTRHFTNLCPPSVCVCVCVAVWVCAGVSLSWPPACCVSLNLFVVHMLHTVSRPAGQRRENTLQPHKTQSVIRHTFVPSCWSDTI